MPFSRLFDTDVSQNLMKASKSQFEKGISWKN